MIPSLFNSETYDSNRMNAYLRPSRVVVWKRFSRPANLYHSWPPRVDGLKVIDNKCHLTIRDDVLVFLRFAHIEAANFERARLFIEGEPDWIVLERPVGPQSSQSAQPLTLEVLRLSTGKSGHGSSAITHCYHSHYLN
ncbi:MAG: hypothetical protein WAM64_00175 [Acidimicrobiales bacterium]